jgi:hypothetical protein
MIKNLNALLLLTLIFFCNTVGAIESEKVLAQNEGLLNGGRTQDWTFGHLVNQTAYTLASKDCTIGYVVIACGASDSITLGFSPWLVDFYNMSNFFLRKKLKTQHCSKLQFNSDTLRLFQRA